MMSRALIGWEDSVFPYEGGGLGIRDLHTMNKAALTRHLWNIIRKNFMWVEWVLRN